MSSLDIKELSDDLFQNELVVGLILAGSTAKNLQNHESDLDVYIILKDSISNDKIVSLKGCLYKKYHDQQLDLSNQALQTIAEFETYARVETTYEWDRYNLVHTKLLFDKTDGAVAQALESKKLLTNDEADTLIDTHLSAYISLTYRSIRSYKAGNNDLAKLDQVEAAMYMLVILFTFQKRVRPYNKYLAWELERYPLHIPSVNDNQLYDLILGSTIGYNYDGQIKMYTIIEKIARSRGRSSIYDVWSGKLDAIE